MHRRWVLPFVLVLVLVGSLGLVPLHLLATEEEPQPTFVPDELLIRFQPDLPPEEIQAFYQEYGLTFQEDLTPDPEAQAPLVRAKSPQEIDQGLLETMQRDPRVLYAEPNYILQVAKMPDDPDFDKLWGLHNTGQTGGKVDADIDAPEAWDIGTGSKSVIVAVIDTGVDYNHPDLVDNMWTNPKECPQGPGKCQANGKDDDGNGYVDDFYGVNTITGSGDPMDDFGHGTHVAGILGASGNNQVGVVGVNWKVRIAACKFLSASGSGTTANAIKCFNYFKDLEENQGIQVRVTNNSWGGGGASQALKDAMAALENTLHAAAAGNSNSSAPSYPAAYDLENIVSVAATDHNDEYAGFSNWGVPHVDLAAPGVGILSTVPKGSCPLCSPSGYASASGTSMATPYVAGAAALIWSQYPNLSVAQVKQRIMAGVDLLDDTSKETVTNGRLNLLNSLEEDEVPPAAVTDLTATQTGLAAIQLTWTATGDDGFKGKAHTYDLRYSTQPIDEETWDQAIQAVGEPKPLAPGTLETFTLTGLEPDTTYYVALRVLDNVGNASKISNLVLASTLQGKPVFQDDMENGPGEWTVAGIDALWHLSTRRSHSPETAWYYGIDGQWNYDTGGTNTGVLVSPVIELGAAKEALLVFWEWSQVEQSPAFDRTRVQVSTDGQTWTTVFESHGTNDTWQRRTVDLTPYLGKAGKIQVRFWFDTVDSRFNKFEGWYIDDVQVLVPVPKAPEEAIPRPNLVLPETNIGLHPAQPTAGQPVTVQAVIFNHGSAPAENVTVQFLDVSGDVPVAVGEPQVISQIPVGGSGGAQVVYETEGKAGERTLRVVVDPNDEIRESNEGDNQAERSLTVAPLPLPNLVITQDNVGFQPPAFSPEEPVTIHATVRNDGPVDASNVTVLFLDVTDLGAPVPIGDPVVLPQIPAGGAATATITYDTGPGHQDRRIEIQVDPDNFIQEAKETDNQVRVTLSMAEAPAPNLVLLRENVDIRLETIKPVVDEGDPVVLVATVLNRGGVPVRDVQVQFLDATDRSAPEPIQDIQVIDRIPPGGSATAQVTYDTTGRAGDRTLQIQVDPHNFIPETRETDNRVQVTLAVAGAPEPNLVILDANLDVAPSPVTAGEPVTVTGTVINLGDAPAPQVTLRFMDITQRPPQPVASDQVVETIPPGGSAAVQVTYTPDGEPGQRTIQVQADPDNFIPESDESDNVGQVRFTLAPSPLPNLRMLADNVVPVGVGPQPVQAGQPVTFTVVVRNTGGLEAENVVVQLVDLTHGQVERMGPWQVIEAIPPGGSAAVQLRYDTTGRAGSRRLQVQVDPNNLIQEANEADNQAGFLFQVAEGPQPNLVLVPENVGFHPREPREGERVTLIATVRNDGAAPARDVVLLFTDVTEGQPVPIQEAQTIDRIPPGGSATAQVTYRTEGRTGIRSIRVVVDPDNFIDETDETDNRVTVELTVGPAAAPNLRITSANVGIAPPRPQAGEPVTLTATVLNTGGAPAQGILVQFLDVTEGQEQPIGEKQAIAELGPGQSATVQVPYGTEGRAGKRRIQVVVDPDVTVAETDETDNRAIVELTVAPAPLPDLLAIPPNIGLHPVVVKEGEPVQVTVTVRNAGGAAAEEVTVQILDASQSPPTPIGPHQTIDRIPPGSSATVEATYETAGRTGRRTLRVVVDPNNTVVEEREDNNQADRPLLVVAEPGPNLVMEAENIGFDPPAPGEDTPVTVIATVRNAGLLDAEDVVVQFLDATTTPAMPIGDPQVISRIPAGGSATAQVLYHLQGVATDRKIQVVVDPTNRIRETDETDNRATATLKLAGVLRPNLVMEAENIGFDNPTPQEGEPVTVRAVVRNTGTVDAQGVAVRFADATDRSAPVPIGEIQTIPQIPAGGSGMAQVTYDTTGKVGKRTIQVTVDPANFILETRESDNQAQASLVVTETARANLVMVAANLGFDPPEPQEGDRVTVHVVVLNQGGAPARDVAVQLLDITEARPETLAPLQTLALIPPGGFGSLEIPYETQGRAGERQIRVRVDPQNLIPETNEDDNEATRPLSVRPRPVPNPAILAGDVTLEPEQPRDGDVVSIRATVRNADGVAARDVVVALLEVTEAGPIPVAEPRLVDLLPPGGAETVLFLYDTTGKTGDHTLRVVVDPRDRIQEGDETDNAVTLSLSVAPPPGPNLTVSGDDIRFTPPAPAAGDPVTVTVTVRNDGDRDAAGVAVAFFDATGSPPQPIGAPTPIGLVPAGGSATAQVVYDTTGKEGERTIQVVVDPDNQIPELDEEDNAAEATLTVGAPGEPGELPNLRILPSAIRFDPSTPQAGEPVTITVTVRNTGQADAAPVAVAFFDETQEDNPVPIGSPQLIQEIPAGSSGQAQVVYDTTGKEGERTIRVVVDPDNQIPESNEEDNTATRTLTVGGADEAAQAAPNLVVRPELVRVRAAPSGGTEITVTVVNAGPAEAQDVTLTFARVVDGRWRPLVPFQTVARVPGRGQAVARAYLNGPLPEEGWILGVMVDPENRIPESNEGDNVAVLDSP